MPKPFRTSPLPQDLRNWSFRDKDCEGWDFSGRDLRGCNFSNAKLAGADFSNVITGKTKSTIIPYVIIVSLFMIAGVLIRLSTYNNGDKGTNTFSIINIILTLLIFLLPYSIKIEAAFIGFILGIWASATAYMGLIAIAQFQTGRLVTVIFSIFFTIVFLYISLCITRGTQQIFNTVTGTNFKGADLQGANFKNANLHDCNLDNANRRYFNFNHISSPNQSLKLQRANLSNTNFTNGNLQDVDLSFTNLINIKAEGANFCKAILTGSCIQDWTINSQTRFNHVICNYIYFRSDMMPLTRFPTTGNFKAGEFEQFIRQHARVE